ncbi:MAG: tetratricopeptide repeat protein [Hyphomicrobiaceae bacterium]
MIIESGTATPAEKAQAYAMRALALSIKGQYDAAIRDYDESIRLAPDFAVALNNRAWAYFKSGRGIRGLPDVERSLQLNPLSEHTWDTRAHIRQTMGQFDGAFADYERAVDIGGERMIKLYQCGLTEAGLYRGKVDGIYSSEVRDALRQCANRKDCDPLPGDEQCRQSTS